MIGLEIYTDEVPVIANTRNMLIISHLYLVIHLVSNFLTRNKKNLSNKKNTIMVKKAVNVI